MGTIVKEEVAYNRYLTVYNREVEFADVHTADAPSEPLRISYDIIGHPKSDFQFAVVVPFHPATAERPYAEVTLIREYIQSSNAMGYSLPTGGFDAKKHASLDETAERELAEEARLEGGSMVPLMEDPSHRGFIETKWCANRFKPFLCLDPTELVETSVEAPRDAEEFSIQVERVSVEKLRKIMYGGEMMVPSIIAAQMALNYLEERGLLDGKKMTTTTKNGAGGETLTALSATPASCNEKNYAVMKSIIGVVANAWT